MSHLNIGRVTTGLIIIILLIASLSVAATSATATEHTVTIQDGSIYYYGSILEYNNTSVNSGEDWTIRGQTSGNTLTVTAQQAGSVKFDTTSSSLASPSNLQNEKFELVNPSGTVVATFTIKFQTLNASAFSPDIVQNSGSETTTSISVDSNRTNRIYDLLVSEQNSNISGSEFEMINSKFTKVDSTTAVNKDILGKTDYTMDFDNISAGTHEIVFTAEHAVEPSGSGTLVPVTSTSTIVVEDASGSITGSVSTSDDYSGDITVKIEEEGTDGTFTSTQTIMDGSGSFTFNDVPVNTYTITLSAPRHDTVTKTGIQVNDEQTTDIGSVTLQLSDTVIEATVDVQTLDGTQYDRQVTVELQGQNGSTLATKDISDGNTASFIVQSKEQYTIIANDKFITKETATINVDTLGKTYTTTLQPQEKERGTLDLTVSTTNEVREIHGTINSTSTDWNTSFELGTNTGNITSGSITETLAVGEYQITMNAINHEKRTVTVNIPKNDTISRQYNLGVKTYPAEPSGKYWVGQQLELSSYVSNGDTVTFINKETGEMIEYQVENGSNFIVSTEVITSAAGTGDFTVQVNGTSEISITISKQSLSSSFTSNMVLNYDMTTSLTLSSERESQQTLIITKIETPDKTINGSAFAEMNSEWNKADDVAYTSISTKSTYYNLDFTKAPFNVTTGEYTVTLKVSDTGATSTAKTTVEEQTEENTSGSTLTVSELVSDATIKDNGLYWKGQVLSMSGNQINLGEKYRIYKDGTLIKEMTPRTKDEKLIFSTKWERFGIGDYKIEDQDSNTLRTFIVRKQTVSASFKDGEVFNTGSVTTSKVTFQSNRTEYPVAITLKNGPVELSPIEIATRFKNADVKKVRIDGETVTRAYIPSGTNSDVADFKDLATGTYTFKFNVIDSTASTTAKINVKEMKEGRPVFTDQFFTAYKGNIAETKVIMTKGVGHAILYIGRPDKSGYQAKLELTDPKPNTKTTINVLMNIETAGQGQPDKTFDVTTKTAQKEGQTGENVSVKVISETNTNEGMLDTGSYLLQIESVGAEKDISALKIKPIKSKLKGLYVLPKTTSIAEILQNKTSKSGSSSSSGSKDSTTSSKSGPTTFFGDAKPRASEIPVEHTGVIAIHMTGLNQQFSDPELSARDFEKGSTYAQKNGTYLTIEQTATNQINQDDADIPVSKVDYRYNEKAGYLYFIIEPKDIEEAKVGQSFKATFTIDERNGAIESKEETIVITQEFHITKSGIEWGKKPLEVEPESNQPITVKTDFMAGTKIEFVTMSFNTAYPFLYTNEASVNKDGTVSTTFNFSKAPIGTEFQVSLSGLTDPYPVKVVKDASYASWAKTTEPSSAELTIELVTPDGSAASAQVTVASTTKTIDGSGTFTVPTEEKLTITANSKSYKKTTITTTIDTKSATKKITLEPNAANKKYSVKVTVQAKGSKKSIQGATVSIGKSTAKTGSDGVATVTITGSGDYPFKVSAEGYKTHTNTVTINSDKSTTVNLKEKSTTQNQNTQQNQQQTTQQSGKKTDQKSKQKSDDSVRSKGQDGFGFIVVIIAIGSIFITRRYR